MKESMNSGFYDSFQIQRKREKIQNMAHQYADYLCTAVDNAEDDEIIELDEFLHSFSGLKNGENSLNDIEKIKFFLSVPRISSDTSDVISSYIESSVYGWQDNKYVLSNRCLRENSASHCKNISRIANVTDAEHVMGDISEIFLDEEYGSISTLIFSYCISALFASKLNRDHCTPPFYLQIACDRESAFYQLVEELVDMCDINSGLLDRCALLDSKYRSCHSSNHKYYPSPSLDRDLNELLRDNRDTPVIISGFESGRSYGALLRKIVNMSNKTRNLELRDRFNVIPLFMGKELVSDYDNVLSLDLTNFDIEHSYLHLVRKRKKFLASLVFELVENYEKYLLTNEVGISSPKQQRFFRAIGSYALSVEKENSKLPLRVARNIGFLEFFFSGLMNAFSDLCAAFREEKFTVFETPNGQPAPATVRENTVRFTDLVENTLVKLHRQYLPDPTETDIKDQDAAKLAKKITKEYHELHIHIRVVPTEVKKDRYIFNVQTLQNTRDTDVSKAAETVQRRLKNYDYFRFNLNDSKQIKLVVAKQVPQDNNLNEIFQHPDFKDPQKKIPYAMGFDSTGTPFVDDIADFNLLMLGESNSGKSTAIRSLLTSVAYKHRSGDVNVIIMDFLGNNDSDYSMFSDQPFLSAPIIRDPLFGKRAIDILYKESKKRTSKSIPHIICVMDEFPNFFSAMTDITEKCYYKTIIEELLSGGRHSNIHMVMASQTLTKRKMVIETNNFQTRLVFRFPTAQLSESILNRRGAEKLRGKGQAIFDSRNEYDKHLQCTFMPERDMKILLKEIKETFEQKSKHRFTINMEDLDAELLYTDSDKPNTSLEYKKDDRFQSVDEVLPKAIFLALGQDKIAKQTILTTCKIGDKKALIVLEKMKQMGLVERLKANEGWKVIPRQLDNICDEALSLLEHSGYSRDTIAQRFKHEDYSNPDSKLNTSTADK